MILEVFSNLNDSIIPQKISQTVPTTANSATPVLGVVRTWYYLVVKRTFWSWDFSLRMPTEMWIVTLAALLATLPCKSLFVLTGPLQLKDSAVLKLS